MPNRIIRDGVLASERYHSLNNEARLLFFELVLNADDYGLIQLSPAYLRMRCPLLSGATSERIAKLLGHLCDEDLLRYYTAGDVAYGYIPRFGNAPRSLKPKFPLPPEEMGGSEIKQLMQNLHSRRIASVDTCIADVRNVQTSACETEVLNTKPKKQNLKTKPFAPQRASTKRGHRLPPDWRPATELLDWAKSARPDLNLEAATASFIDYWQSAVGRNATKLDWDATYRNWIRNSRKGTASRQTGFTV